MGLLPRFIRSHPSLRSPHRAPTRSQPARLRVSPAKSLCKIQGHALVYLLLQSLPARGCGVRRMRRRFHAIGHDVFSRSQNMCSLRD